MNFITPGQHTITLDQPGHYELFLDVPGVEIEVTVLTHLTGRDQVEYGLIIHHRAPHTRATTTMKGVVEDQGFLKFMGRIIIDENCGDTNSFLTERILLLSDKARAEAIPDLEILSDDVKCSHAATISRIPEEHLFYLMSRGLSRPAAQKLIIEGFLS